MNTVTFQLNDKQYDQLMEMVGYGKDWMELTGEAAVQEGTPHDALVEALESTKSYLWTESLGRIELDIPASIVDSVAQSGQNLPAAEAALNEHPYIAKQLERYEDAEVLEAVIDDIGLEQPAYTMNIRTLHQYILWHACWDIFDERNTED